MGVLPCVGCFAGHTVGMDVCFSGGGGKADALIFQHTSEATHHVPLEVGKVDAEVVFVEVVAHNVVLDPCTVFDRYLHVSFFVHDIDTEDAVETMFMDGCPVFLHILSAATIGGAALNDGAIHFLNEVADEWWLEVVVATAFACADFYSHLSMCFHAKGIVDFY